MLNNKFTILFLIQFMLGYNIFYHTQDYKIASSSYVASYDTLKNIYNFSNPACNQKNNRFIYSILGNNFNGILNHQQLFFTLETKFLDELHFALLRTSIDDINDTESAWNDINQDNIVDISEIDYSKIGTFSHNNLGLIISKPFYFNQIRFGINTKLSTSQLFNESSFTHSFDLGVYKNIKKIGIGIVLKDFLNRSYWSTNEINKDPYRFLIGTHINIKSINLSFDYDFYDDEYMIGTSYDYNSLISIQLGHSVIEKFYLGFLLNFEQFNLGYAFVMPKYQELGTSQRIVIGINKDSFLFKL